MHLLRWIFFTLFIPILYTSQAQSGGYNLFRSFTMADGLPGNHIYHCVEDNNGFLWVATDAGIARFDGKRFQVFSKREGLPDSDVLYVVKEKNGRIWINHFKQTPAYFDEIKNRFISAREDTNLGKIIPGNITYLSALPDGGVKYSNGNGTYFFENGKQSHLYFTDTIVNVATIIKKNTSSDFIGFGQLSIKHIENDKIIDSFSLSKWFTGKNASYEAVGNKFYFSNLTDGRFFIFSDFTTKPLRFNVDTVSIGEPIFWRGFTPNYFTILSKTGAIHVFDKETLKPQFIIRGNYSPKSLFNDSKGNIWVATVDKGLMLYKKSIIDIYATPDNFKNNSYLSIAQNTKGSLLAGNHTGQIVETDGKYFIAHQIVTDAKTANQHTIIVSQNKVFSFSEGGDFVDYKRKIVQKNGLQLPSKTAFKLNDSIIIAGGLGALHTLNIRTENIESLSSNGKRVTAITTLNGNIVYHGSTDGLYKIYLDNNNDSSLVKNHPLFAERVTALCTSADNYVWVGTPGNGLYATLNDSVAFAFTMGNGSISNSINCITQARPGEIWIGTNSGISIVRYNRSPANFTYQNLTINDGLSSNTIKQMVYSNDTVYCATGSGICAIPANINLPQFNIPVQLTGVTINNRDTSIAVKYDLGYRQTNIELQFAGVELGGHFNYFQYRIDNGNWQKLEGNNLNLQLSSGKYAIAIRAVDVNGHPGSKPLMVNISIATPFWRAVWFWLLMALLLGSLIFWWLRKRELAKREIALQEMLNQKKLTELELHALKSQINPHFIFNCLNSIKFLGHQQKHAEAEKYLDKFAMVLRSAMEQSSLQEITLQQEIDFIENYLSLEKLRFPEKLSFSIDVDKQLGIRNLLMPSMLLQPYLENAVKHGIAPLRNRHGLVQVTFYEKNNTLIAEVQDNGNGIEHHNRNTDRVGIGMDNTERRSQLYHIETKIINLKSVGVHLNGTLVQLTIPLKYKPNT